ncbi:Protein of unknown function DUF2301, transmembrane [Thalassoporum mexicanum PCC 7367]|uniref:DUF2301 domain-containing membrane protein n=1 Tax=Thalassoporum mexicanum TaxID=3457544 RepID=UPI00029FF25C|nr:DUF2301 domain-containing membrane protein [Pseudanabaena sp. PCC 7367]AFY70174.1 Protein of unknown function DUF2301, transmembrane [Pseudanabaena sp. PCC 7367]
MTTNSTANSRQPEIPIETVYKGQFGEFTVGPDDRQEVIIYRAALAIAAASFCGAVTVALQGQNLAIMPSLVTGLYAVFCVALAIALTKIHIYLALLHRTLQAFLAVGCLASVAIALQSGENLAIAVYQQPLTLIGVGFTFAALTGIYFKEAFCFNRFETKILTVLVPFLLVGHMVGKLPIAAEQVLLAVWAMLFFIFALRKLFQDIPADIGDKSVFSYLKSQRQAKKQA